MSDDKDWFSNRIREERQAGREQNALAYEAFAKAEHEKGVRDGIREAMQIASEQAALMADMAIEGLPENSGNREAMEAALVRFSHTLRYTLEDLAGNLDGHGPTHPEPSPPIVREIA